QGRGADGGRRKDGRARRNGAQARGRLHRGPPQAPDPAPAGELPAFQAALPPVAREPDAGRARSPGRPSRALQGPRRRPRRAVPPARQTLTRPPPAPTAYSRARDASREDPGIHGNGPTLGGGASTLTTKCAPL